MKIQVGQKFVRDWINDEGSEFSIVYVVTKVTPKMVTVVRDNKSPMTRKVLTTPSGNTVIMCESYSCSYAYLQA